VFDQRKSCSHDTQISVNGDR